MSYLCQQFLVKVFSVHHSKMTKNGKHVPKAFIGCRDRIDLMHFFFKLNSTSRVFRCESEIFLEVSQSLYHKMNVSVVKAATWVYNKITCKLQFFHLLLMLVYEIYKKKYRFRSSYLHSGFLRQFVQSDNLLSLKQNMKMHSKKVYSNILFISISTCTYYTVICMW